MKPSDLDFPEEIISILDRSVASLNPPQEAAVRAGLLERKNLVVASPTASGKTLIAELAILKNFLRNGKSVYLVPLKALASEKYREFKEKYEGIGMRIAISVGDLDSTEDWLKRYDLVIASNEKMDSMLRHNADWIGGISLIIADEVHLLNDASRGPTLEVVLTRLRSAPRQLIALSATIKNAEEIAEWLDAELVKSDYRPVKLHTGVYYCEDGVGKIEFVEKEKQLVEDCRENEVSLSADTLSKRKQALMFLSTRSSAEAAAEKISKTTERFLTGEEKEKLSGLSDEALDALSSPTKQCRRLSALLKRGVAFHHAGLVAKQRKIVEDGFRDGTIKILTATPTLAFGLNLPAWRVVIRDVKRFSGYGADYIPVLEVQQMCGRAGRPKYDKEGEAVLVAKSRHEAQELWERYILGEAEPIYSKLSVEPVLRMHVLALIASDVVKSRDGLRDFFSKTFFARQYGDIGEVMEKVDKVLKELESYTFIRAGGENFISSEFVPAFELGEDAKLSATRIGKRVSQLYIDPQSANLLVNNIEQGDKQDVHHMLAINQCMEMRPLLRVKNKEYEDIEDELAVHGIVSPDSWNTDYDDFLSAFKTSLMLNEWMSETGEDFLLEKFGITPGELYAKTANAEWMLYAAAELAILLNKRDVANSLNKLRLRIKYGVKEELLPLIRLKNIGRMRARSLHKNGIKSFSDIKTAPVEKLEKLLGKTVARQLKERSEEDLTEKMRKFKRRMG